MYTEIIHYSGTNERTACDFSHAMPTDVSYADLQNDEYEDGYALALVTCTRCRWAPDFRPHLRAAKAAEQA